MSTMVVGVLVLLSTVPMLVGLAVARWNRRVSWHPNRRNLAAFIGFLAMMMCLLAVAAVAAARKPPQEFACTPTGEPDDSHVCVEQ